ncbi:hypothetical protein ACFLXA_01225 [Chloroflexota bacterium]
MDIFQTIGAILAVLLLLFQLISRVPRIRRAFGQFIPWLKDLHRNFKEWWYWRANKPKCRVVSNSPLYIKAIDDYNYALEAEVTIEFISRDEYSINFITSWFYMEIKNNERGPAPGIYKLENETRGDVSTLPNTHKSLRMDFTFKGKTHGKKPSLPNNPKCMVIMPGVRHPVFHKVRGLKTDSYQLQVEWL